MNNLERIGLKNPLYRIGDSVSDQDNDKGTIVSCSYNIGGDTWQYELFYEKLGVVGVPILERHLHLVTTEAIATSV